jgi:hypothetical protein
MQKKEEKPSTYLEHQLKHPANRMRRRCQQGKERGELKQPSFDGTDAFSVPSILLQGKPCF